jgi:hypothetical protein
MEKLEEIGAPSMYELTKFIYLFNNPEENDTDNNSSTDNTSSIHGTFNEQDVQGS